MLYVHFVLVLSIANELEREVHFRILKQIIKLREVDKPFKVPSQSKFNHQTNFFQNLMATFGNFIIQLNWIWVAFSLMHRQPLARLCDTRICICACILSRQHIVVL